MTQFELTDNEIKVIDMLRKLQPYGKIEIAMNQSGTQFYVTQTKQEKTTLFTENKIRKS